MKELVIVRGGGDIATGTIYKLVKSGFRVLVLETAAPSAIRRNVAFSEAVYDGISKVEDMTCRLAATYEEAEKIMEQGDPALMIDPEGKCLEYLKPLALVDAILAKKNLGTRRDMAPVTIGLGPGFTAGKDVDAVIETKRGHRLGRVIREGKAIANTGIPGVIAGVGKDRVIHSPEAGILRNVCHITDTVKKGQTIARIETEHGTVDIPATIDGLLRGLIRDQYPVTKGFKIADIDPRIEEYNNCFTISDKARCIGGGVLEAILTLQSERETIKEGLYADYAATNPAKPRQVKEAVWKAMSYGNAGRGVHRASLAASRNIFQARQTAAEFFQCSRPEQVSFTSGITASLNIALKGILNPGDHVITTYMEHNSVLRPLYELEKEGISLTITSPDAESIAREIRENTRMVVMAHGSNVTGEVFDIQNVGKLCRENGIVFVADTAQTAGIFPISMEKDNIDVLCFAGHKALLGPQGVGGLCVREGIKIRPLLTGGSGFDSFSRTHPERMPEALEAGTLNGPGIAGLEAGIRYLMSEGLDQIRMKEQENIKLFYQLIKNIPDIRIYGMRDDSDFTKRTAVLSCNLGSYSSSEVSDELAERFGIQTRSGAHCAPLVHEYYKTKEQGMVRFSFGYDTTEEEIRFAADALNQLAVE
ncbi:selenium-dependent molybdenum cofactor biosynthesis protein YqeB [Anaerostipes butyraticus]|uniref:selenium-dependent molybdenum cofactor biosynthesis protein YqeB n=1 Tax=Anaerostipes butyraticus TaxID=645466 RepID=UPI002ED0C460